MSVQKMKKINICALKEDRKRILEYIQRKGCIEISKFEEDDFEKMNTATQISVFERSVVSCENALEVLSLYSEEKTGLQNRRRALMFQGPPGWRQRSSRVAPGPKVA